MASGYGSKLNCALIIFNNIFNQNLYIACQDKEKAGSVNSNSGPVRLFQEKEKSIEWVFKILQKNEVKPG
ncbi:hypothetical protein RSJ42_07280 [Methanosarcina hadiensis]|uniref:hypothetical protein n=1 Tax=Methanosarcina hadiensis TaxID=3078083 RepID=UPI003977BCB4